MKVALVELAIWVFWTAMLVSAGWVHPLMADQEKQTMFDTILTFNTQGGTEDSYKSFIQQLRNQLEGSKVENIQVLRDPSTVTAANQRFLLVRLQSSQDIFVTLVVDVTTLYVLGYADKYDGKDRAHFFSNDQDTAIPLAKRTVFQGATLLDIPYGISYGALETAAGSRSRQGIPLGIKILQSYINKVFGLAPAQTPTDRQQRNMNEATFLLIAIQMVSEAARSNYIEGVIHQDGLFPDDCVIALELVWTKISEAIQKVGTLNTGDKLDVCPGLKGLTGDGLTKAIIDGNYMGILKYKEDGVHV